MNSKGPPKRNLSELSISLHKKSFTGSPPNSALLSEKKTSAKFVDFENTKTMKECTLFSKTSKKILIAKIK